MKNRPKSGRKRKNKKKMKKYQNILYKF